MDLQVKILDTAERGESVGLDQHLVPAQGGVFAHALNIPQLLADHLGDQLHPGQLRHGIGAHQLTVAQHRDPVAELIDLIQEVGDKDDPQALGLQLAHHCEQALGLLLIQGGGGLVQDQHLCVHIHRTGNGNHLLDGHRVAPQRLCHVNVQIQRSQQRRGPAVDGLPVDAARLFGLTADKDVLRHAQIGAQVDLLIHGGNAALHGLQRAGGGNGPALHGDLAAVLCVDAGQDLNQGGFSRAVFADQRVDFTGVQGEIHILQRADAGEVFTDSPHCQQGFFCHRSSHPLSWIRRAWHPAGGPGEPGQNSPRAGRTSPARGIMERLAKAGQ